MRRQPEIETETEVVEVQALASVNHGESHCFVLEPSVDASSIDFLVKKGANLGLNDQDDMTARTAISTELDDYSLREKFSYGGLYLADTGTFTSTSHNTSFDASRTSTSPDQGNVPGKIHTKNASLLDLDDEEDCRKDLYDRRFFGSDSPIETVRDSHSFSVRSQSVIEETLSTMSRAEFYGGYCSESSTDLSGLSNYALSRSRFVKGTLDTDSPIEFYRVSGSESHEPLSCREKLEVIALVFFSFYCH